MYDLKRDGVTQGLLTTFLRCRQEAKNYIEGLEPLQTSAALQFGSMGHLVVENVYRNHPKKAPTESVVHDYIDVANLEYINERGGRLSAQEEENMEMTMLLLEAVMPEYFKFRAQDFVSMRWAELEKKFRVPSPIPGVDLVGRIDGACWIRKELWQFETKTKSRIEEEDLSQKLTFDFQNNVYQYVLLHNYKTRPQGVLYNIIRRPGQRLKQGESLPAFKSRVIDEVRKDPKHFFVRFEVNMPATESSRFVGELRSILREFVAWNEGRVDTYRNTSACMQQYGACKYLPLCANNELNLFRRREGEIFAELKRP